MEIVGGPKVHYKNLQKLGLVKIESYHVGITSPNEFRWRSILMIGGEVCYSDWWVIDFEKSFSHGVANIPENDYFYMRNNSEPWGSFS